MKKILSVVSIVIFFSFQSCISIYRISNLTNSDYLKREGNFIHAYVILPNRMHSIISFAENGQNINTTVGNGIWFMAYEIVERLKVANKPQLPDTLSLAVPVNRKQRNQKHSIWEPSFDWKYCYGM